MIIQNNKGGKQSKVEGDFTLLPFKALVEAARVLEQGAITYEPDYDPERNKGCKELNWTKIGCLDHLNHGLQHALKAATLMNSSGEPEEIKEELAHALCRLMFTVDTYSQKEKAIQEDNRFKELNKLMDKLVYEIETSNAESNRDPISPDNNNNFYKNYLMALDTEVEDLWWPY